MKMKMMKMKKKKKKKKKMMMMMMKNMDGTPAGSVTTASTQGTPCSGISTLSMIFIESCYTYCEFYNNIALCIRNTEIVEIINLPNVECVLCFKAVVCVPESSDVLLLAYVDNSV